SASDLSLAAIPEHGRSVSWQQRLEAIASFHSRDEIMEFLQTVCRPALEAVRAEIGEGGLSADLTEAGERLDLTISHGERPAFRYTVRARGLRTPSFAWADTSRPEERNPRYYRGMA